MSRHVLVFVFLALVGCAADRPPDPSALGRITSRGGTRGDWDLAVDRCSPDSTRVLTVDLHGAGNFEEKRYVRVTRVAADEDGTPTLDVELVDAKTAGGPYEVVIDPALAKKPATKGITDEVSTAHCRIAEGWIVPEPNAQFSGAFRFSCLTLDGARVAGVASFSHCKGESE